MILRVGPNAPGIRRRPPDCRFGVFVCPIGCGPRTNARGIRDQTQPDPSEICGGARIDEGGGLVLMPHHDKKRRAAKRRPAADSRAQRYPGLTLRAPLRAGLCAGVGAAERLAVETGGVLPFCPQHPGRGSVGQSVPRPRKRPTLFVGLREGGDRLARGASPALKASGAPGGAARRAAHRSRRPPPGARF